MLDGEEVVEDFDWSEVGFKESGGVQETWLIDVADWVGGVKGGDGGDVT